MADVTSYNYGLIESGCAHLTSLNTQFQQTADDITKAYNKVADTSLGQAVNAGVQFNQQMTQTRTAVSDLVSRVIGGVHTATSNTQARDATNAGHMG